MRDGWSWPRRGWWWIAVALTACGLVEVLAGQGWSQPRGVLVAAVLFSNLPLGARNEQPLLAVIAGSCGILFAGLSGSDANLPVFVVCPPFLALFALGEGADRVASLIGGGALAGAVSASAIAGGEPVQSLVGIVGAGVVLGVGRAVAQLDFESEVLGARVEALERDHNALARAAVEAERKRIARELHDVIGHSISVMGVQAGAVRRRLTAEQAEERELLLAVERGGRDSVAEIHRLLLILREPDLGPEPDPLPTMDRAHGLIDDMRRAGQEITFAVEGDLNSVSPGRGLAAYRILQEALTNALKHAPRAPVGVTLHTTGSLLELTVSNPLPGTTTNNAGLGHGLIGMRERVGLYGGTLDAGGTEAGQFVVHARLPLGTEA